MAEMKQTRFNAAKGYGWDVNPWVWKYTFERVEKPNEQ